MAYERMGISDPALFDCVQDYVALAKSFEIFANGSFKHMKALSRTLHAVKDPRGKPVGFLDAIRLSPIIGCLGLVNEHPKYDWWFSENDSGIIVVCEIRAEKQ